MEILISSLVLLGSISRHFKLGAIEEHVVLLLPTVNNVKIFLELLHILLIVHMSPYPGIISKERYFAGLGDILVYIIDHD